MWCSLPRMSWCLFATVFIWPPMSTAPLWEMFQLTVGFPSYCNAPPIARRGAVWSSAPNESFVSSLEEVFSEVKTERVEWHNELIDEDQCDLVFLARR